MRFPALLLLCLALLACAPDRSVPQDLKGRADWVPLSVDSPLPAKAWVRGQGEILVAYIEGDGRAYVTRNQAALDPTPREPGALLLALADSSPAVAYLGRACQYGVSGACGQADWTTARFSETALAAENALLDRAKAAARAERLVLCGWSGGGAMAALLAARRSDVALLVTVCGNLDSALWTRIHGVPPLEGSLNPADSAPRLGRLPQVHFSGEQDEVVPPEIAASFARNLPAGTPCALRVLPGLGHEPGAWAAAWPSLRPDAPSR